MRGLLRRWLGHGSSNKISKRRARLSRRRELREAITFETLESRLAMTEYQVLLRNHYGSFYYEDNPAGWSEAFYIETLGGTYNPANGGNSFDEIVTVNLEILDDPEFDDEPTFGGFTPGKEYLGTNAAARGEADYSLRYAFASNIWMGGIDEEDWIYVSDTTFEINIPADCVQVVIQMLPYTDAFRDGIYSSYYNQYIETLTLKLVSVSSPSNDARLPSYFTLHAPSDQDYARVIDRQNNFLSPISVTSCPECSCGCSTVDAVMSPYTGALEATAAGIKAALGSLTNPHTIITIQETIPAFTGDMPTYAKVKLYFGVNEVGDDYLYESTDIFYALNDGSNPEDRWSGDTVGVSIQAVLDDLQNYTGLHGWTMVVSYLDDNGTAGDDSDDVQVGASSIHTGHEYIDDRRGSPYGTRWEEQDRNRILATSYGIVWQRGKSVTWYPIQEYDEEPENRTYQSNPLDSTASRVSVVDPGDPDENQFYKIESADGSVTYFTVLGQISSYVDPLGNVTSYTYDEYAPEVLTSITYADGSIDSYTYSSGFIDTVTHYKSSGGAYTVTDYDIDATGIQQVTYADPDLSDSIAAPTVSFKYDNSTDYPMDSHGTGLLREITDELGQVTTIDYDWDTRQVKSVQKPCGGTSYVGSYLASTMIDPTSTSLTSLATLPLVVDLDSFDARNYQLSRYADRASLIADLNTLALGWEMDEAGNVTFTTYDNRGFKLEEINALNERTTWTRLENGLILTETHHDPDGAGPLESVIYTNTYSTPDEEVGNSYIVLTQAVNGKTTTLEYTQDLEETPNYYAIYGIPSQLTDDTGRVTRNYVNSLGQVLQTVLVIGTFDDFESIIDDISTSYTYTTTATAATGGGTTLGGLLETMTDALGHVTKYSYYADGRVSAITSNYGTSAATTVSYTYDSLGYLATTTDEVGRITKYENDRLGRNTKIIQNYDPLNTPNVAEYVTTFQYDLAGRLIVQTDPNGLVTEYTYGLKNKVETVSIDPDGVGALPALETHYEYNCVGLLKKEIAPNGAETEYVYDALNRLQSIYLPNEVTGEATDADGIPTGMVTQYRYDGLGRLIEVKTPLPEVAIPGTLRGASPTTTTKNVTPFEVIDTTATPSHSITLANLFADSDDALTALRYEVISVSDAGLFEHFEISNGKLILKYATGETAAALTPVELQVRATDPLGNTVTAYVNVTRETPTAITIDPLNTGTVTLNSTNIVAATDGTLYSVNINVDDAGDTTELNIQQLDRAGNVLATWTPEAYSDSSANLAQRIANVAITTAGDSVAVVWTTWDGVASSPRSYQNHLWIKGAGSPVEIDLTATNTITASHLLLSGLAATADLPARLLVVSSGSGLNANSLIARQYDLTGTAVGSAVTVDLGGTETQLSGIPERDRISVVGTRDGGFTLTWQDGAETELPIHYRKYDPLAMPTSIVRKLSSPAADYSFGFTPDGGLVTAWTEETSGPTYTVKVQHVTPDGGISSHLIEVATGETLVDVVATADGGYVVATIDSSDDVHFYIYDSRDRLLDNTQVLATTGSAFAALGSERLIQLATGEVGLLYDTGSSLDFHYLTAVAAATESLPLKIVGITPGQNVLGTVDQVVVEFNQAVDSSSWYYWHFYLEGPTSLYPDSVVPLSQTQVALKFSTPLTAAGVYKVSASSYIPDLDQDGDGTPGEYEDSVSRYFTVSALPQLVSPQLYVTSIVPGEFTTELSEIYVDFSQAIDGYSWSSSNFEVLDSTGQEIALTDVTVVSQKRLSLNFTDPLSTLGNYTVRLKAYGTYVDQNRDGWTGQEVADDYIESFKIIATGVVTASKPSAISSTQYDAWGRVTKSIDAAGTITTYSYNDSVSGDGTTSVTVTEAYGSYYVTRQTTSYYDEAGRLIKVVLPSNTDPSAGDYATSPFNPVVNYVYDKNGNLLQLQRQKKYIPYEVEIDDTNRAEYFELTDYRYDERDRLVNIILPNAATGETIDEYSDPVTGAAITTYYYDAANQLRGIVDALGRETYYEYDALGRTSKIVTAAPTGNYAGLVTSDSWATTIAAQTSSNIVGIITSYNYDVDDAHGSIVEITSDPDGSGDLNTATTRYEYDLLGRAKAIYLPDPADGTISATPLTYTYNADGELYEITDEDGRVTRYTYDELGRATLVESGSYVSLSFVALTSMGMAFDAAGNLRSQTDALGRVTQLQYDQFGRLVNQIDALGGVTSVSYDALHRQTDVTDALGRITSQQYDTWDRVVQLNRPDANGVGQIVDQTAEYDLLGNLYRSTKVPGTAIEQETRYLYDARSQLIEVRLPAPSGTYEGDAEYEDSSVWYAAGPIRQYEYDNAGQLTKASQSITDSTVRQVAYGYDAAGRRTHVFTADAATGFANYDAITPANNEGILTLTDYDDWGRVIRVTAPDPDGAGDLASPITEYDYDYQSRLVALYQSNPDPLDGRARDEYGVALGPVTNYVYSASGELLTMFSPEFEAVDGVSTIMARLRTDYNYDAIGRLTAETLSAVKSDDLETLLTSPGSQATRYGYDTVGNRTRVTNAVGNTSFTTYDAINRVTSQLDPRDAETTFAYDAVGNLLSITDAGANTTSWEYDRRDRSVRETNQLGYARLFEYDNIDRLTAKTDRTGRKINYSHDALDRMTQEEWRDLSNDVVGTYEFDYDLADQLLEAAFDGDWKNRFTYDQRGNAIVEKQQVAAFDYVLNNTFDQLDRRTYSDLRSVIHGTTYTYGMMTHDYDYNSLGQITSIAQRDLLPVSGPFPTGVNDPYIFMPKNVEVTYNGLGQTATIRREQTPYDNDPANYDWHEAVTSQYTYDTLGRVKTLAHVNTEGWFSSYIGSWANNYGYTYDDLNRITQFSSIEGTSVYDYDGAGQLIDVDHTGGILPADEGYDYDENGNRLEVTGGGGGTSNYVIGPNNQVLEDGQFEYTYDDEGNRLTKFRLTPTSTYDDYTFYTYDHRQRLVAVTFRDGPSTSDDVVQQVEYGYDAMNRRNWRAHSIPGVSYLRELYAYDGHDILLEQHQTSPSSFAYFTFAHFWLPGGEQSLLLSRETIGDSLLVRRTSWALADAQGTYRDYVNATADSNPELLYRPAHIVYDTYGSIINIYNNWWTPYNSTNPGIRYTWAGLELDTVTGLHLADNRQYDAKLGSWTADDPIMFDAGQSNLRMYTGNDPVNYVDPSGLHESPNQPKSPQNIAHEVLMQESLRRFRMTKREFRKYPDDDVAEINDISEQIIREKSMPSMGTCSQETEILRFNMLKSDLTTQWWSAPKMFSDKQARIAEQMHSLGMEVPMQGDGSTAAQMFENLQLSLYIMGGWRGGGPPPAVTPRTGPTTTVQRGPGGYNYDRGYENPKFRGPTQQPGARHFPQPTQPISPLKSPQPVTPQPSKAARQEATPCEGLSPSSIRKLQNEELLEHGGVQLKRIGGLERPPLSAATKKAIEAPYKKNAAGQFIEPKSGNPIIQPQYGHREGLENWRILRQAERIGLNQNQVNEFVNAHPHYFEMQGKKLNESHLGELLGPDPAFDGRILQDMGTYFGF